jgi:hypothetical protein
VDAGRAYSRATTEPAAAPDPSVYHPGMSLARAWTRQFYGASGAALMAPATIIAALLP